MLLDKVFLGLRIQCHGGSRMAHLQTSVSTARCPQARVDHVLLVVRKIRGAAFGVLDCARDSSTTNIVCPNHLQIRLVRRKSLLGLSSLALWVQQVFLRCIVVQVPDFNRDHLVSLLCSLGAFPLLALKVV